MNLFHLFDSSGFMQFIMVNFAALASQWMDDLLGTKLQQFRTLPLFQFVLPSP